MKDLTPGARGAHNASGWSNRGKRGIWLSIEAVLEASSVVHCGKYTTYDSTHA